MKTPRDILLAHHQAAAPKLDAIRRSVVDQLSNQGTQEQSWPAYFVAWLLGCPNKLWQELVWPSRRIWAGLAAIWIGILILNFSQRENSPAMAMKSPSPQMIMTWQQQERLLAELIGPNEPGVAEPPKRVGPRPRSELRLEIFMT